MITVLHRRAFLKQAALAGAAIAVTPSATRSRFIGPPGPQTRAELQARNRSFFANAKNRPEVIAHRGGAKQWPEETLFAFRNAVNIGVDVLEMDVRSTRDNHLVLMHNRTVKNTTNGMRAVRELSLAQLRELDAGYRWSSDGKTFPFRGQGLSVATLEEVFRAFPQMRMNIEIKQREPSLVAPLAEMITAFNMTDKVLVASRWASVINDFRQASPDVATSASLEELWDFMRRDFPASADALQVEGNLALIRLFDKRHLDLAHSRGFHVHVWTVNRIAQMRRWIDWGVDGIITVYPGPLLSLLGR
ncbi:MAG: glycerophosphodiester phosphodiesterase [Pyrinomonadaceae bacterium]